MKSVPLGLAVLLFLGSAVISPPEAQAQPQFSYVTYYYLSTGGPPVGSEGHMCWGYIWAEGDRTPGCGDYKQELVYTCGAMGESTEQWYRFNGCTWLPTPEPAFNGSNVCSC